MLIEILHAFHEHSSEAPSYSTHPFDLIRRLIREREKKTQNTFCCLNNYSRYLFENQDCLPDFLSDGSKVLELSRQFAPCTNADRQRGSAPRQSGEREQQNLAGEDFLASQGVDK